MPAFGLSVALLTPFKQDGSIDVDRLVAHASDLLSRGVQSITVFGTTGEGASVGASERAAVLTAMRDHGIGADQIILGVCETSVPDALARIAEGVEHGITTILLTPPYFFNGLSDAGLFAWHAQILDGCSTDVKIILYNIPQVTDVPLSAELTSRIVSSFPGRVRAMKDSSGSWDSTTAFLAIPGLTTLVGDERLLHRAMQQGAGGAISGMANLHPERMRRIVDKAEEDPDLSAETTAVVSHPVVPAIKALIARNTGIADWTNARAPLLALGSDESRELLASAALDQN